MAIYDLPLALKPVNASWGLRKAGAQFTSPFNGSTQSVDYIAERWAFSTTLAPMLNYTSGEMEVLGNVLAGGVNRLRAGHPSRKVPLGSLRGTPTLQSAASRGNTSLVISATTGQTLEAGDYIGVAGHLLQVAAPALSVGGVMLVQLVNRIRAAITAGTAVMWNAPTALFICQSMQNNAVHAPGFVEGMPLDFIEVYP